MDQVVIIGAGQAGHCAAFELRRQQYGGRILLVGEEALQPYERPPLSKAVLVDPQPPQPLLFSPVSRYEEQKIELVLSQRVEAIERAGHIRLSGGTKLFYDHLLIATGGVPRKLDIEGGEHVTYLRNWPDALAIRRELRLGSRVICIGGGVIGLEIAASAIAAGCAVTVLEAGPAIMNRCLARGQAALLEHRHAVAGVEVRLRQSLTAVEATASGLVATVGDGSSITADFIVAGIGMVRNTTLAAEAGLEVDNGILVDRHARTSQDNIFAAGDVAAFEHVLYPGHMRLESWYHAQYHGACAGRAIAGRPQPYDEVPRFWTDQYELNIQVAGFPAEAVSEIICGDPGKGAFTVLHADRNGRLVGVTAVNQARSMRPSIEAICRRELADATMLQSRRPASPR